MTEPLSPRTLPPSRWRRPALAFTLSLAACLGGESLARAETVADVAGPANAVLARLEERKAALARAGASVVGVRGPRARGRALDRHPRPRGARARAWSSAPTAWC